MEVVTQTATGIEAIRNELESWDDAVVARLNSVATLATAQYLSAQQRAAGGGAEGQGGGAERGTSGENPFYVKDISNSQHVKIVMDAAETQRFLRDGTLDTIGQVVREALEGGQ